MSFSVRISQERQAETLPSFLCMLPVAAAPSSSGAVAIMLCTSGFVDDVMLSYDGPVSVGHGLTPLLPGISCVLS